MFARVYLAKTVFIPQCTATFLSNAAGVGQFWKLRLHGQARTMSRSKAGARKLFVQGATSLRLLGPKAFKSHNRFKIKVQIQDDFPKFKTIPFF